MKKANLLLTFCCLIFTFGCNKQTSQTISTNKSSTTTSPAKAATAAPQKSVYQQKQESYEKQKQEKQSKNYDTQKEKELIKTDSNYKSYYESGFQKHNQGDFAGAIADYNKAIDLNPSFGDAYNARAMSKYKSGDKTGACSDWHKAQELGNQQSAGYLQNYCN